MIAVYKDRHVQKVERNKYRERPVFAQWQEDTPEVIS